MANIKKYTDNIRKAIYGKEVRESLATGIEVINTEVEENTTHVNETVKDIEQFKNDINSAETKRVSNENTRIENEETRQSEFKKIVDKNGTWDKKLSDLYNTNNSSLDSLNTNLDALHKNFKSKYDNLEREYAQDITDIKDVQGRLNQKYKIDSFGVHPSSNGYVQDMKLYGKSLVNLLGKSELDKMGRRYDYNNSTKILTNNGGTDTNTWSNIASLLDNLTVGQEYTFIYEGKTDNTDIQICSETLKPLSLPSVNNGERKVYKFISDGTHFKLKVIGSVLNTPVSIANIMLIAGDHTQNPPPFFEGMKSVGDDVENIKVLSRKEDGNLLNINNINDAVGDKSWYIQDEKICVDGITKDYETSIFYYVKVEKNKPHTISLKNLNCAVLLYNGKVHGHDATTHIWTLSSNNKQKTFTPKNDIITVRVSVETYKGNLFVDSLMFNLGSEKPYEPYKGDKKTILFKDEDGLWKKPILREWDSIEEYDTSKYYYNKRSNENVLNGSKLVQLIDEGVNTIRVRYYDSSIPNIKPKSMPISDKFIGIEEHKMANIDYECISTHSINSTFDIRILKTNADTLDKAKTYIQNLGANVIYQLAQEQVYECLDISVRSFNPQTLFSISSGAIDPIVDAYMPNSLISSDYSICNKIDSLELDCNYKFNKINEFTNNVSQSIKNIFNKLKELTDVQISISENGYLKFPTLFGGILLQWGRAYIEPSTNKGRRMVTVNYPVSFNDKCYSIQLNPCALGDENGYDLVKDIYVAQGASSDIPNNNFTVIFDYKGTNIGADIRWFAIGK